jgi:hypothetical protein
VGNSKSLQKILLLTLIFVGLFFALEHLFSHTFSLGLFALIGLGLGYIESRAEVGMATGYTSFFVTGSRSRLFGLLLLFALSALGAAVVHSLAATNGAVPAFQVRSGDNVIPGTTAVSTVDLGLISGAFIFGIGLTINQACGMGTLRNIGQGKLHYGLTLLFLLIGTIPGQFVNYQLDQSVLHDFSLEIYLPNIFGYAGTILIILALVLLFYIAARRYEKIRREQDTYTAAKESGLPLNREDESDRLHLGRLFKYLWKKHKARLVSILIITLFFLAALIFTGEHLSVTQPLLNVAVALFQFLGFSFDHPAFAESLQTVENGLLNNTTILQNIGIIIGAIIFVVTNTKDSFSISFNWRESGWYILSGLLMGFGAVLASGCIVGAMYSGIVNLSLSGWVVFISMGVGILVTIRLLRGRVSTIPTFK